MAFTVVNLCLMLDIYVDDGGGQIFNCMFVISSEVCVWIITSTSKYTNVIHSINTPTNAFI